MDKEYKYIKFIEIEEKHKTSVYSCQNNKSGTELGKIKWYPPWRRYCYFPTIQAVYNNGCLNDMSDFLTLINS